MKKEDLRIVYFGTPDFAVESLRRLVEGGYNVVGVVTTPDKPVDRHKTRLCPSPVKSYALEHGLPLMQPEKLRDEGFLNQLRLLHADLQIVVAFRMMPEVVWAMPHYGTFNLHASLLPQYRGAAPINWAIINGEKQTGVTTFFLEHDIDTGAVIDQSVLQIGDNDTFEEVHDKLMVMGGDLVLKTVDAILEGTVNPQSQQVPESGGLKSAPKIFRDTCRIDWTAGMERVHDFVRGLSPVPAAWTMLKAANGEQVLKIFKTTKEPAKHHYPVGSVLTDGQQSLKVALEGGFLNILELQLAGKKRMKAGDFLRGNKLSESASVG